MRIIHLLPVCMAILPLLASAPARAEDTPEDRLRAALKQSVTEMRAAQDQASTAQTQLAQAQADLAAMKAKYDADEVKLAQFQGKDANQSKQVEAALQTARQQNSALQQSLSKYQGAVQQAQEIAREKDRESQRAAAGLQSDAKALQVCKDTNKKLIDVAEKVLHLYQDRSFLWVLRKSYEPLIGSSKVDLQNIVQDYDDKIAAEEYIPSRAPAR